MEVRAILEQEEECDISHISVNAIAGISDYTTMKVKGVHRKRPVFVVFVGTKIHAVNFL